MKSILITGSAGLIGYELSQFYLRHGWSVIGVDNDQRGRLFGVEGSGQSKIKELCKHKHYSHFSADIQREHQVNGIFWEAKPDAIVHCAAQPSHEQSGKDPLMDFRINALGTVHILEAARKNCPDSPFVHMSSSKVYGDVVNQWPITEYPSRFDWTFKTSSTGRELNGVHESVPIDQSLHSPYGASKASSDLMAQEYARYYDMPVVVVRPTNMTGPAHSSIEAHGYLHYLVRCCVEGRKYRVIGYKGKQVRDNIHSDDVVSFVDRLVHDPKPGQVYNLGSGKENARSILETIALVEKASEKTMDWEYVDQARKGDHIVYYTDISKARKTYPGWEIENDIYSTINDMVRAAQRKLLPA